MTTNRRDFLGQLLGSLLAVKTVPYAAQELISATKRFYDWYQWSGFKRSPNNLMLMGQFVARRADDREHFYANIPLSLEDADRFDFTSADKIIAASDRLANGAQAETPFEKLIMSKIEKAQALMESFLDSKCTCSAKVLGYKQIHDEEFGDMRVPIHPFCELHNRTEAA